MALNCQTTAVHPGMVLLNELEKRGIAQSALATHIGVRRKSISEICRGKRGISAAMAVMLSCALGARGVLVKFAKELGTEPGGLACFEKDQTDGRVM